MNERRKSLGIVGGLHSLASADLFFKLTRSTSSGHERRNLDLIIERYTLNEPNAGADLHYKPASRKICVFNAIKSLEKKNVDSVLLSGFISHTFIDELKPYIGVPLINQFDALNFYVRQNHPHVRKLGLLTSGYVRKCAQFERTFDPACYEFVYPSRRLHDECLMQAVYGPKGINAGYLTGKPVELLAEACHELSDKGAELIVPGIAEIPIVIDALRAQSRVPVLDSNKIYAEFAVDYTDIDRLTRKKIGVIGGVGPSATIDFLNNIILNTPATRDQDHVQMIIDHDPTIPDRTENLLRNGPDPTIALFAACKRLESNGANLIAIPCNTAHAFIEEIQSNLSVPIINMIFETVQHITRQHGEVNTIGLLATEGTVKCRIYHDLIEKTGRKVIVPDPRHQELLMSVIYGDKGVKAGYSDGPCLDDFQRVLEHVINAGSELVILGCTELPLLSKRIKASRAGSGIVSMLDPGEVLAIRCVELAVGFKA